MRGVGIAPTITSLLAAAGCETKPPPPAKIEPVLALPSPMTTTFMMARVRAHTAMGMAIESLRLDYVRADGTLDPIHGEFDARISRPRTPPPPPPDDPGRPLGAPVPTMPPPRSDLPPCYEVAWRHGELVDAPAKMCFSMGTPLAGMRCSPPQIWQRAIADGAPATALARITLTTAIETHWTFAIDDEPRNVHFSRRFSDDCAAVVEQAP